MKEKILLIVTLFFVTGCGSQKTTASNSDVATLNLKDIPVEILSYNENAYVLDSSDVPKTVEVNITGLKSEVESLNDYEVFLDLENIKTSDDAQKVKLTFSEELANGKIEINPAYVEITFSDKVADVKTLDYKIINEDNLADDLAIGRVDLIHSEFVVKGSKKTLDQIEKLNVHIDVDKEEITKKGIYYLLISSDNFYDNMGNSLENVEVVPKTVEVEIEVVNK